MHVKKPGGNYGKVSSKVVTFHKGIIVAWNNLQASEHARVWVTTAIND